MPKISVVMPAYNVERHIGEAIESILHQTMSDWELVIVDDCSTDSTSRVVEGYAAKDSRIKLIRRLINSGGAREPRHQAVMLAQGEFVCNIDADDVVVPTYLQSLYDRHLATNADGVTSRLRLYNSDLSNPYPYSIPASNYDMTQVLTGKEACRQIMGEQFFSVNGYLCKTEVYKRYIEEDGTLDIDTGFADEIDARKVLLRLNKVAFCDVEYKYRQHPSSVVHDISIAAYNRLNAYRARLELAEKEFSTETNTIMAAAKVYLVNIYRAQILFYFHKGEYTSSEKRLINNILNNNYTYLSQKNIHFKTTKLQLLNFSMLSMKMVAKAAYIYSKILGSLCRE